MANFDQVTVTRGRDAAFDVDLTRDGAPLDLTSLGVAWRCGPTHDDPPTLGPITASNGTDPTKGVAQVALTHDQTATLVDDAYLWEAVVTDAMGGIVVVARGVLHVLATFATP